MYRCAIVSIDTYGPQRRVGEKKGVTHGPISWQLGLCVLSIHMVLGFAVLHALVPPLVASLKIKERGRVGVSLGPILGPASQGF